MIFIHYDTNLKLDQDYSIVSILEVELNAGFLINIYNKYLISDDDKKG